MKASYIQVNASDNCRSLVDRLGKSISLTPLKTHFFERSNKLYIRVPEDISPDKLICAAKDRGLHDAQKAVDFLII